MKYKVAAGPVLSASSMESSSTSAIGTIFVAIALLTKMSTVPNRSATAATKSLTWAEERTSQMRAKTFCASSSPITPVAGRRSAIATFAPARPRASAMPRPTPRAAPVTMATLSSSAPTGLAPGRELARGDGQGSPSELVQRLFVGLAEPVLIRVLRGGQHDLDEHTGDQVVCPAPAGCAESAGCAGAAGTTGAATRREPGRDEAGQPGALGLVQQRGPPDALRGRGHRAPPELDRVGLIGELLGPTQDRVRQRLTSGLGRRALLEGGDDDCPAGSHHVDEQVILARHVPEQRAG